MARARKGTAIASKIQMLLYGKAFTGKSTLALQSAYLKNNDGKPFRLLVIDPESGGVDDYLQDLENNGINLDNIFIVYTQSLTEVREYIKKAKNNEDFHELDEDGNETDNVILDADGNPFRADIIIVDGASVLNLTTKHGLVDFSKKRARVKAERDGIYGDEKFVKVESAFLELKDYQVINFKGQDLILDLTGSGKHYIITAREVAEKETKQINGKEVSVLTGEFIPEGFKEMDYNAKTVIRMYRDNDDYETVKAFVRKDRTHTHKAGDILEDPTIIDWQSVIDKSAGKKDFIISNNLENAIETEAKAYAETIMPTNISDSAKVDKTIDVDTLKNAIETKIKSFSPVQKSEAQKKLAEAGLPKKYKDIADIDVLEKILNTLS